MNDLKSVCVEKMGCPECGAKKANQVFYNSDGTYSSYCFSCSHFSDNPYNEIDIAKLPKPKIKSREEIEEELKEVRDYPFVDVPQRKLRAANLEKFGVKVALNEADGKTPMAMYFPYTKNGNITGYQVKTVGFKENKVFSIGDAKGCDLFGWEEAKRSGAYRLIITEGPVDAVAVWQIYTRFNEKEEYLPAVVSLPYGAGQAYNSISKVSAEINRLFKEVIFCFDNDEAGKEAAKKCSLLIPKATSVILPEKDANACIMEGRAKAAYSALAFQKEVAKNTSLVRGASVRELAKQPAQFGELSLPFDNLNKALRGIRYGDNIYIAAGVKCGKTVLKNCLAAHFMSVDDQKVFMACPEESNVNSYKLIAGQLAGRVFHDPEVEFDEVAFDEVAPIIDKNLFMLDAFQHVGWSTLKRDIITAVEEGCKVVMIDPITNLTNGMESGEANRVLQDFAQDIAAMAQDLKFAAFMFSHLKANEAHLGEDRRQKYYEKGQFVDLGNCAHEAGGSIYSNQIAGSRAMMRSATGVWGILANKDPDLDEEIRNTRTLQVMEDRQFGVSGKFPLFYNKNTSRFREI